MYILSDVQSCQFVAMRCREEAIRGQNFQTSYWNWSLCNVRIIRRYWGLRHRSTAVHRS